MLQTLKLISANIKSSKLPKKKAVYFIYFVTFATNNWSTTIVVRCLHDLIKSKISIGWRGDLIIRWLPLFPHPLFHIPNLGLVSEWGYWARISSSHLGTSYPTLTSRASPLEKLLLDKVRLTPSMNRVHPKSIRIQGFSLPSIVCRIDLQ